MAHGDANVQLDFTPDVEGPGAGKLRSGAGDAARGGNWSGFRVHFGQRLLGINP
jgi:hypothetical protein